MHGPTACGSILVAAALLFPAGLAAEIHTKALANPGLVSPKRAYAQLPRLVVTRDSPYLLWHEAKGPACYLSIARIDTKTKSLGPASRAMQVEPQGWKPSVGRYAAITLDRLARPKGSQPAFLEAV